MTLSGAVRFIPPCQLPAIRRDEAHHRLWIQAVDEDELEFFARRLDNDGVGYATDEYNKDLLPPETIRRLDEAKQKIISGQIKVTNAMDK